MPEHVSEHADQGDHSDQWPSAKGKHRRNTPPFRLTPPSGSSFDLSKCDYERPQVKSSVKSSLVEGDWTDHSLIM